MGRNNKVEVFFWVVLSIYNVKRRYFFQYRGRLRLRKRVTERLARVREKGEKNGKRLQLDQQRKKKRKKKVECLQVTPTKHLIESRIKESKSRCRRCFCRKSTWAASDRMALLWMVEWRGTDLGGKTTVPVAGWDCL